MKDNPELRKNLRLDSSVVPLVIDRGDGTWAGIYRYMYTTAIVTGSNDDWTVMTDRWCYRDQITALIGLYDWRELGFKGEPKGWHRNPFSGRRRKDGDPTTEYVAY